MEDIKFTINIPAKDLNQALAVMGQDVLSTKEQVDEYRGLTFDLNSLGDDLQSRVGLTALVIASYGEKKMKGKEGAE